MTVDPSQELALLREELRAFMAAGGERELGLEAKTVTKTELVRGLLAHLTKTGGEHSTVKIGRNAQGMPTFEVQVRTGESNAIASAADAAAEAIRLYRNLEELLPYVKPAAPPAGSSSDA